MSTLADEISYLQMPDSGHTVSCSKFPPNMRFVSYNFQIISLYGLDKWPTFYAI